jgi:FlaA1/EpsC-like NDP-sugar epimerase
VLVIGGAGTIGSSYIKAILKFTISKLVVIDLNENGLTELVRDLRSSSNYNIPNELTTYPIDFGDEIFEKIFIKHGPFEIVANFAAHKHVRSEKDVFSIEAMIKNNVNKARNLLDLLLKYPVEHFFCVSTDKAANPVNIMGASKKLMEELILAYSSLIPIKTARFANVAFSNGSLPLGFINRINKNQPLSCPLGIRRFFVSPKESGELCLIASILGDSGDIFFPKLTENDMISFDQIANDLLKYLGLKPDLCSSEEEAKNKAKNLNTKSKKYPIYFFSSDTSGEKTYEEFYTRDEKLDLDSFFNLGVVKNSSKRNLQEIDSILEELNNIFFSGNVNKLQIVNILKKYLSNFEHIETGKNLDQKM